MLRCFDAKLEVLMSRRIDRKQLIRDYKARKTPRGVFAVRSTTGLVWVGASTNLDGAKNGLWFILDSGNYKDHALQQEWNELGSDAFRFEVVEKLEDEVSELRMRDVLAARKQEWVKKLAATAI